MNHIWKNGNVYFKLATRNKSEITLEIIRPTNLRALTNRYKNDIDLENIYAFKYLCN